MSEKIRVLLVDDSAVVRSMVQRGLRSDPAVEVVATATNGQEALDALARTTADVAILDIEMPVMDGLAALPRILKLAPKIKVIMASTLTLHNAEISLRAMAMGAADYVAKPSTAGGSNIDEYFQELLVKIKALTTGSPAKTMNTLTPVRKPVQLLPASAAPVKALAIASSTGGPQALMKIFDALKGRTFRVPVFITQHMPANFTAILANHISTSFAGDCHEAVDGEQVKPGVIYLAPGDFHMTVEGGGGLVRLKLDQRPPENFCRPAADPMFRSLAEVYGPSLLAVVLTGLGSDGARGAEVVASAKGTVLAQDEASSVVYGMPRAAAETGVASAILPLDGFASYFMSQGLV